MLNPEIQQHAVGTHRNPRRPITSQPAPRRLTATVTTRRADDFEAGSFCDWSRCHNHTVHVLEWPNARLPRTLLCQTHRTVLFDELAQDAPAGTDQGAGAGV